MLCINVMHRGGKKQHSVNLKNYNATNIICRREKRYVLQTTIILCIYSRYTERQWHRLTPRPHNFYSPTIKMAKFYLSAFISAIFVGKQAHIL